MPPELIPDDEDYASEEDSDFAVDDVPGEDSSVSDGEGPAESEKEATPAKRKRQAGDVEVEAEDAGFGNSGDEAIIQKGKKRRKKSKAKDGPTIDDEGGEGGLIKTRSMRAIEKIVRKAAASSGPVTVDVDALWAQMTSEPTVGPLSAAGQNETRDSATSQPSNGDQPGIISPQKPAAVGPYKVQSETIRIKRTYNFAGKVHTEEKLVARDSAEARLYLESLGENDDPNADTESSSPPKRMPKKAFRSAFEPITDHTLQRSDLNLGMSVRLRARELANEANAKKLNTVEKSRMDWAGYVDKEGIKDELQLAGKAKDSFIARQNFLARSEAKRDEDARRVRLAGKT
ncbi:bucentaur or craniofacial development-domain-containing protein [Podospora didyma]|uniref:SWR1-complex protein 5 n=1 Tax=Podospora didyma TaxID=330526 RepID=A0AAE0N9I9_9PEZI|nr:bucentaur or craniofacial development-domain-containing protein [Podospora didyma]